MSEVPLYYTKLKLCVPFPGAGKVLGHGQQ